MTCHQSTFWSLIWRKQHTTLTYDAKFKIKLHTRLDETLKKVTQISERFSGYVYYLSSQHRPPTPPTTAAHFSLIKSSSRSKLELNVVDDNSPHEMVSRVNSLFMEKYCGCWQRLNGCKTIVKRHNKPMCTAIKIHEIFFQLFRTAGSTNDWQATTDTKIETVGAAKLPVISQQQFLNLLFVK